MSGIQGSEGDTGSQRQGGVLQGDAFTKREAASENQYIHQKEMEKAKAMRERQQQQSAPGKTK